MLTNVLVANRGEIAVRVIRACRELGITTTAVYSELDRDALHVRLADQAFALGGQTAAESYLNTERMLEIIEESGADGVHPGYGFFSENADFARVITDMGVAFIGPPPEAIEVMGDKISARHAAEKVGVFGVPGSTDLIVDPAQVLSFGDEHGWPVAIKAAYGGGGRGMKVVQNADEVESAIESAQRESLAYFGRDEIYMEKFLSSPRHVEVQVLADTHGNCVSLGTRDCSAQRRHQKLIEEAPAPGIDPSILAAMSEAAIKVAVGCDYTNAGTVEFLFEDGKFFYLEMNTRLQVEHPVTELVTGIDLVEQQLRVASGEALSFGQSDIEIRGHAIEVRINAEDPAEGAFLPSPGPITRLDAPDGFGTRFDTGYSAGDQISQFYDNLVGKLCVWGHDRPTAIRRALRALDELVIEGIATTIPADIAILESNEFQANTHSTNWVENGLDLTGVRAMATAPADEDGEPLVEKQIPVEVNGRKYDVKLWVPETSGAAAPVRKKRSAGASTGGGRGGNGMVEAPMQGTIVEVKVAVGDTVTAGDAVVVLEAMKMENSIAADIDGTIAEVKVAQGDSVGAGDLLVKIDAA
ncbi:MAG: acetyl-CoA/propionyl-CoA carboxylase biotin carboxyl carrier protein [Verrucomicrobiales bacterium]|jgi:acetyl-CoA/propionyl-CoA carboxylase biotin carboxyl carrier protein